MSDTEVKSYRYLRTAMVGLLIGLGAAVIYQTGHQGFLLDSVSAYYYTPAQAMFVGGLIGLGACMIALKGTTPLEDISLNLGGMFATVVAIVPTARSADYAAAVHACEHAGAPLLTDKALTGVDCPSVLKLAEASRANVENNMTALLIVGGLGLIATVLFALRDPHSMSRHQFWWGLAAALLVWVAGAVGLWGYRDWFIDNAHYIAAVGLFVSLFVVAVANALRRQGNQPGGASVSDQTVNLVGAVRGALLRNPVRFDRYAWLAWLMVGAGAVMFGLVLSHLVTLFWLEIVVVALFMIMWMVQTVERMNEESAASA